MRIQKKKIVIVLFLTIVFYANCFATPTSGRKLYKKKIAIQPDHIYLGEDMEHSTLAQEDQDRRFKFSLLARCLFGDPANVTISGTATPNRNTNDLIAENLTIRGTLD